MASRRAERRRACSGKSKHKSRQDALWEILKRPTPVLSKLNAYRCQWCHHWHVGHRPGMAKIFRKPKFIR